MWMIAVTDPDGKRHHNLSWFMADASLPGITIQPQYLLSVHGEGSADAGHKNTVFFENVRVPAITRVGAENAGWEVATTHLEVEHGATGSMRQDPIWNQLLEYCRTTRRGGQRLIDDPAIRIKLARVYSELESVRLLSVRNFWMSYTHVKQSYEGPQVSYYRRIIGLGLTKQIQDIVGLAALTNDPQWGAMDGFAEAHQRSAIVAMHPGGTTDIQRVIMARRLGIGNRSREQAGQLAPSA
jgi:alkylation response protein AidB-like acyl-CoA dehydrogenase